MPAAELVECLHQISHRAVDTFERCINRSAAVLQFDHGLAGRAEDPPLQPNVEKLHVSYVAAAWAADVYERIIEEHLVSIPKAAVGTW
jgi:hypothetical protein